MLRRRRSSPPPPAGSRRAGGATPLTSRALVASLVLLALTAPSAAAQTRPFTPEDALSVVSISGDVAVSTDGRFLAYVLPDVDDEWNVAERRQVGAVHLQSLDPGGAGRPEPIGAPGTRSSFPAFSPDSRRLAFFREGPGDGGRLALLDLANGTIRDVGAPFGGRPARAPVWASTERIVYARPAATEPEVETPRVQVLRSTDETLPGDAFFRRRPRAGLAVTDLATGRERTLIEDGGPLDDFDVSPDGHRVLVRVRDAEGGRTLVRSLDGSDVEPVGGAGERLRWTSDGRLLARRAGRLVVLRPEGEGAEPLTELAGVDAGVDDVAWAPGGARWAALVTDPSVVDPEIEPPIPGMYTIARPFRDVWVGPPGEGVPVNLTARFPDRVRDPAWSPDGSALYFVATDNETFDETLYRWEASGGTLVALASGRRSFGPPIPVPGGVVLSIETATAPADLWRIAAAGGAPTRVTDLNPRLAGVAFAEPELLHFHDADGERLGALLYRPPGVGDVEPVGVVTYVYEKLTPGVHRFQPRQQIFATHGFAVLMPNVKVRVGETGTSFVKAVVPAVNAVRAMGFTNGKFCLWGGSFGAYATSFVITRTDAFACAVSRATPPELFRNWASGRDRDSDNIERGQARMGGSPYEVMERYLSQSAFFHLDKVETPVLITHGVQDRTILFEEGAMMFYALRRLGKEATFVAYREGDHSLYRHSRADFLDVHQRMLAWFGRYLR